MKLVTMFACLAFITACARVPEGMKELKSSDRIVYQIPRDCIDSKARYWGVDFETRSYESARSGFKYRRTAKIVGKDNEQCEITFSSVLTTTSKKTKKRSMASSRTYVFEVDKSKSRGVATVEFRPLFEVIDPLPRFVHPSLSQPDTLESAMEVLATSGVFTFEFEVDSFRAPEAILGRFRKYCHEQSHPQPVTILSRSFTTSYLLASGDKTVATFYLSLAPKGKGTRATVVTRLPLAPDANYRIDAVRQATDIRQVIADIINS